MAGQNRTSDGAGGLVRCLDEGEGVSGQGVSDDGRGRIPAPVGGGGTSRQSKRRFRCTVLTTMTASLRYRGRLQVRDLDQLEVDLRVRGKEVLLISSGGSLGSWPLEEVDVVRVAGGQFCLKLAGEEAMFYADDVIAFSYEGMPVLTASSSLDPIKRALRRWHWPFTTLRSAAVREEAPRPSSAPPVVPKRFSTEFAIAPSAKSGDGRRIDWAMVASRTADTTRAFGGRLSHVISRVGRAGDRASKHLWAGSQALIARALQALGDHSATVGNVDEVRGGSSGSPVRVRPSFKLFATGSSRPADNGASHTHRYFRQDLPGGLNRSFCEDCGHVSVAAAASKSLGEDDDR